MKIDLNKWVDNEQNKHRLCACGCGKEIIIKKHHHTKGIPKYYNTHKSNMVGYLNVADWVKDQQGKHHCHCGCGKEITIQTWHHKKARGIPTHIFGHVSEKTKKKISSANKGRVMIDETKQKISKGNRGKKLSKETKQKISKANTGNTHSNETKVKISKSRKGKGDQRGTKNPMYGVTGDKHPGWLGGISFEPYCHKFNNQLKEYIRDRDNRTCQGCGVKENGTKLSIHHIHYDKKNCYPDLIAVCSSCNSKANSNRKWHEIYYMRKLLFNKTETSVYNIESELEVWNYGSFI